MADDETISAYCFDGQTAQRHWLTVRLDGDRIDLGNGDQVDISALLPVGDRGRMMFGRADQDGWRLVFPDPLPEDWSARLPRQERHGGLIDRIGLIPALLCCLMIGGALYLSLGQAASLAARLVPDSWDRALGETVTADVERIRCKTPAGQQALDRLASRLAPDEGPINIRLVDVRPVNAMAFPGRQIIVFDGLVQDAQSPDELAGALSHEIGHLHRRDPTVGVIRDLAIGLLIGGSNGNALERQLISTRYGRGQERGADSYAIDALRHANISPIPTARFFARLSREEAGTPYGNTLFGYVASHPLSAAREQAFKASSLPAHHYAPAMSYGDWMAIKEMCHPASAADDTEAPVTISAHKKRHRR